jgi:hypothetical protein
MADFSIPKSRSSSPASSTQASDNMTKSTSDASKSSKRKGESRAPRATGCRTIGTDTCAPGTRSVSTLTPAQLARKRANDREAQRAIRARTKEHIENLERELEELRSASSRDDTVQDLLRKNRALEEELHRLKESMGITTNGPRGYYHPCTFAPRTTWCAPSIQYPVADCTLAYQSPASRTSAPGPVGDYSALEMGAYDTLTSPGDAWPSTVPSTIPSTVSSPSSSGATDDMGSAYYPTSAPSIMDRPGMSSTMGSPTVSCISGKSGYDDIKPGKTNSLMCLKSGLRVLIKRSDIGCPPLNMLSIPQAYQPPPWNMYPMYYTASPTL